MSLTLGFPVRADSCARAPGRANLVPLGCTGPQHRHLLAATVRCLVALGLIAAMLWVGQAMLKAGGSATGGRPYTVAEVRASLERHPEAWVGRTVRVRGMVLLSGCLSWDASRGTQCPDPAAYLLDRDGASLLPVARGGPDPLLTALRRLPLVSRLAPAPQQIRWGALATYRVRLRAAPTPVCGTPPCYEALLLDAEPGSLYEEQQ